VWVSRMVYDYCNGMSWETAESKHLRELRIALGLAVIEPPAPEFPAPADVWPRIGLSYYTSLTDPRCPPKEFAKRLADAGANYTRVWLLDAWALGPSHGTGCYDGYMPWVRDTYGTFDLDQVSQPYLDRLHEYVEVMNAYGVLPQLSGLDLYTWSDRKKSMLWVPDPARCYFQRNKQGLNYSDDSAFDRIGLRTGSDACLGQFYQRCVNTLQDLAYTVEIANEMPQKELHYRLRDAWRAAGYSGSFSVNRNEDTPGQYVNMRIGDQFDRIAYHGKGTIDYLDDIHSDEPDYPTFRSWFESPKCNPKRMIFSSDGCRKSTNVDDAYDYRALGEVFKDALNRWCTIEHQSCMKLRGFTHGRIDLNDLEVGWVKSLQ
jgi:hypothetical protein